MVPLTQLSVSLILLLTLFQECQSQEVCYGGGTPIPIESVPNCRQGYYCPNIDETNPITWPQVCPPNITCQIKRLEANFCTGNLPSLFLYFSFFLVP